MHVPGFAADSAGAVDVMMYPLMIVAEPLTPPERMTQMTTTQAGDSAGTKQKVVEPKTRTRSCVPRHVPDFGCCILSQSTGKRGMSEDRDDLVRHLFDVPEIHSQGVFKHFAHARTL